MDNNGFLEAGVKANRFLYQGKEWQKDLGLNLYDFHARQFDPALGRWLAQDPQNQFASPYLGMGNNSSMMVDPDGNFTVLGSIVLGKIIGAALIGAGIGAASYSAGVAISGGQWDWGQFGSAVGMGDLSGAVAFGVSYRLEIGKDFKYVDFNDPVLGTRAFFDYTVFKSIYLEGLGQWDRSKPKAGNNEISSKPVWTPSAMLGAGNRFNLTKKLSGNFTALYNFLHNEKSTNPSPWVFRVGFEF
jgi:RHS repeat-associated protein